MHEWRVPHASRRVPGAPLHILWIKTELLHPVTVGGRIRTFNMLRELRRRHHVTYLALDDGTGDPDAAERASEYAHELIRIRVRPARRGSLRFAAGVAGSLLSPLPYVVWRARSSALARALEERVARGDIDVVVCDFIFPSENVPNGLRTPIVLFQHNVEAAIWRRHAEVRTNPLARAFFRAQWRRMHRFEAAQCRRFDQVIAVSEHDKKTMRDEYQASHVAAVPTGVDTDYFSPAPAAPRRPNSLVFTGAMDWLPNEDAMSYFVETILPIVHRELPDTHLTIVGRNPSARVRALAEQHRGVTVTGSVPDVRPYLDAASAFIVPLRIGGGTRLKIFEALAMDLPVISTPVGAEGLDTVHGETIVLAESATEFAAAVVQLLRNPAEGRALGCRGGEFVRSRFDWAPVADVFADICASAVERHAAGTP